MAKYWQTSGKSSLIAEDGETPGVSSWMDEVDEEIQARDKYLLPLVEGMFQAVHNGIIFVTSMAIIIFTAIGVMWFLIYDIDIVHEQVISQDFSNAFGPITFIIALITNSLIQEAKSKSTARTRMYADLIYHIEILIRKLAGMRLAIIHEGRDREWRRNPSEYVGTSAPENAKTVEKHIKDLSMYLFIMAKHSYTLFQPHDPHIDHLQYVDEKKLDTYENVVETPIGAKLKYESETSIFDNTVLYMETHLIHLNQSGVIPNSLYTSIVNVLDSISKQVNGITMAQRIATPKIFDQLYIAALGFYLLILVPLQIYSGSEAWIVLIYPVVLIFYVGPILYGFWLGDPLMRYPRFEGPQVLAWRIKLYAEIKSLLFEDVYLDIVERVAHSANPDKILMEEMQKQKLQDE